MKFTYSFISKDENKPHIWEKIHLLGKFSKWNYYRNAFSFALISNSFRKNRYIPN
jgi:hypothetical protein